MYSTINTVTLGCAGPEFQASDGLQTSLNTSVYRLTKGGTVHVLCDVSIERVCARGRSVG